MARVIFIIEYLPYRDSNNKMTDKSLESMNTDPFKNAVKNRLGGSAISRVKY